MERVRIFSDQIAKVQVLRKSLYEKASYVNLEKANTEKKIEELKNDPIYAQYLRLTTAAKNQTESPSSNTASQGVVDKQKSLLDQILAQKNAAAQALVAMVAQAGENGVSPSAMMAQATYLNNINRAYQRAESEYERKQMHTQSSGQYQGAPVKSSTTSVPFAALIGVDTQWDQYASTGGEVRVSQGKQVGLLGMPVYLLKEAVSAIRELVSGESTPEIAGAAAAALAIQP